jgi:hypothetical protein
MAEVSASAVKEPHPSGCGFFFVFALLWSSKKATGK